MNLKTITKRELIDLLEDDDAPDDALVIFATDYGDRGHTEQALGIRGEVEEVIVTESAYSNSGFAISDNPDDEDALGDDEPKFIVIR